MHDQVYIYMNSKIKNKSSFGIKRNVEVCVVARIIASSNIFLRNHGGVRSCLSHDHWKPPDAMSALIALFLAA